MNKGLFILTLCMSLLQISCVENCKLKSKMANFMKSEIMIPKDMESIFHDEVSIIDDNSLKPLKVIVYYDSLMCTSCKISGLSHFKPLCEMSDTSDFSILFIFSPRKSEMEITRLQLLIANFDYPIYLDVNGTFARCNESIPNDSRFSCFLINSSNNPIFIGNPLRSQSLNRLFKDVIDETLNAI